jgi:cleavage stimulation factor subunit 2
VSCISSKLLVVSFSSSFPNSFAFVEFQDPQAALSAIRNMNDYELNGRRIRVNFSNSSHLEVLAGRLGMDLSQQTQRPVPTPQQPATSAGTNIIADSLKAMSKGEMYDVVAKLKEIADRDPDEARRIISGHPQLPEALLFIMSKLDMVKTPLANESPAILPPAVVPQPSAAVRAADPRAAARADPRKAAASVAVPAPVATAAPPAARVDPRQRVDPRAARSAPPPPPPPVQAQQQRLPIEVQQILSLTPAQIQAIPPDQRQHVLQVRQQYLGGTGM